MSEDKKYKREDCRFARMPLEGPDAGTTYYVPRESLLGKLLESRFQRRKERSIKVSRHTQWLSHYLFEQEKNLCPFENEKPKIPH